MQCVYGKTARLFCCAAKLRGEKRIRFSPSYNHYRRRGDRTRSRVPQSGRRGRRPLRGGANPRIFVLFTSFYTFLLKTRKNAQIFVALRLTICYIKEIEASSATERAPGSAASPAQIPDTAASPAPPPLSLMAPIRTRLSAAFFGAFCVVLLALRQQGFVVRNKNPSKNSR